MQAAQIAGLKVLQLINDNTAVALNYGVFRRKDINSTAQVLPKDSVRNGWKNREHGWNCTDEGKKNNLTL